MSAVVGGLQQVGDLKAKMALYTSPVLALIFCACGVFLVIASKKPPPPAPEGQPPNKAPPIGFGIFFIVCGFLIPLLAYGFYSLTMASPTFSALSGAGTVVDIARSV
jgi:p-aminobenzoyl-glutamate transporter AbgT